MSFTRVRRYHTRRPETNPSDYGVVGTLASGSRAEPRFSGPLWRPTTGARVMLSSLSGRRAHLDPAIQYQSIVDRPDGEAHAAGTASDAECLLGRKRGRFHDG